MKVTKTDGTPLRPVPAADPLATGPLDPFGPTHDAKFAQLNPPGFLGDRDQIQDELDAMAARVRMFHLLQPDQVMRECGAYSARLTELVVLLHRVEALDRQYTRVRTMQVDKWLAELQVQFKIASRLVEIMRQDVELSRGS